MNIDRFSGLDLRPGDRPDGALDLGINVFIDSRGSAVRRPGLVRVATAPAASLGLYCVDDLLRAVAPNGTASTGLHPALYLDYVECGTISGRVDAVRLPSEKRLIYIEHDASIGIPVLHVTDPAYEVARTDSRIFLGRSCGNSFRPSAILQSEGRVYALDATGRLNWSGVADPLQPSTTIQAIATDWVASHQYAVNDVVQSTGEAFYLCVAGGISGVTAPTGAVKRW